MKNDPTPQNAIQRTDTRRQPMTKTEQRFAVYFDDSQHQTEIGVFTVREEADKVFTQEVAKLQQEIKDGEWDQLYSEIEDYPDVELALVDDEDSYIDTLMFWCHAKGYHTPDGKEVNR